jgi:hypothetical protein
VIAPFHYADHCGRAICCNIYCFFLKTTKDFHFYPSRDCYDRIHINFIDEIVVKITIKSA